MLKSLWLVGVALVLTAGMAHAQDDAARAHDADEAQGQPRRTLRVLEDPYDIASFYRSSQSYEDRYFAYQAPYDFADPYPIAARYRSHDAPYDFADRYPIAARYRNHQSRRAAGFVPYAGHGRRAPRSVVGYRRGRGSSADLFLIAPTFLAPVGPLTSSFFGER